MPLPSFAPDRTRLPGALSLVFVLLLAGLLVSCAGRQMPADPAAAGSTWQRYVQHSLVEHAPFRDDLSLRFGPKGNTRRVTALLWGNGDRTLRLDVRAGVGATVAMVRQQDDQFLIYAPMERKAFFHQGATSPLLKIGVPLPLDLFRLEALLHGRFLDVFGAAYDSRPDTILQTEAGLSYQLEDGLGGRLVLDRDGRPVAWSGSDWQMRLSFDDRGLVERLDLVNTRQDQAILLVKARAGSIARFDEQALRLDVPKDIPLLPLDDLAR